MAPQGTCFVDLRCFIPVGQWRWTRPRWGKCSFVFFQKRMPIGPWMAMDGHETFRSTGLQAFLRKWSFFLRKGPSKRVETGPVNWQETFGSDIWEPWECHVNESSQGSEPVGRTAVVLMSHLVKQNVANVLCFATC